jgi:hypothetical protein
MLIYFLPVVASTVFTQSTCPPLELIYGILFLFYKVIHSKLTNLIISGYARTTPNQQNWDKIRKEADRARTRGYGAAGYSLKTNFTNLISAADCYTFHYPVR